MDFLKNIFGTVNRRYLVRAYLIGAGFTVVILGMFLNSGSEESPILMIGFVMINLLLFPFAKLVWDELRDLMMGDTIIFQSAPIFFMGKFIINGLLFAHAIFVAPLGIVYLWLTSRNTRV